MSVMERSEDLMKKVIVKMQSEYASIRTGRAHTGLLDGIRVDYLGTLLPINQLGNVAALDARTLEIKPWDKASLQMIEQAILKSDIGLTPQNDGKSIRLSLPSLTTERRSEMVKMVRKQSEEYRVAVRNLRRVAVEDLKKQEKDKKISKDDLFKQEQLIQKLTDKYVKNVDDVTAAKEKEILDV